MDLIVLGGNGTVRVCESLNNDTPAAIFKNGWRY